VKLQLQGGAKLVRFYINVLEAMILVPTADEIAEAQPIAEVLPKDVVDRAIIIATAVHPGSSGIVN
jgi:hypothetical protein